MAKTEDRRMNDFTPATDADYFYAEDKDGNQVKIKKSDLAEAIGCYYNLIELGKGESFTLPYSGGLIMIQNASLEHAFTVASVRGDNNGNVLIGSSSINMFSEVDGRINVFNTGVNTKYVVKNLINIKQTVVIRFFQQ